MAIVIRSFSQVPVGKYYPAVSSYMGGKVTVNFGPDFKHEPPEGSSPYYSSRDIRFFPDDKATMLPMMSAKSNDSLPTVTDSSVASEFKVEVSDQMDQTY